jgi:hypothetical protein
MNPAPVLFAYPFFRKFQRAGVGIQEDEFAPETFRRLKTQVPAAAANIQAASRINPPQFQEPGGNHRVYGGKDFVCDTVEFQSPLKIFGFRRFG